MGQYIHEYINSAPPSLIRHSHTLLSLHATLVCRCRCPSASGLGELWRHIVGVALGGDPLEGLAAREREAHARDHDERALVRVRARARVRVRVRVRVKVRVRVRVRVSVMPVCQ